MTVAAAFETRVKATEDDALWQALLDRDSAAGGGMLYSVATMGVFCRIGCPSRPPLRKNVRFHLSAEDARLAGFRACKRCRPEG